MPGPALSGGLNEFQLLLSNGKDDGKGNVSIAGATWSNQVLPNAKKLEGGTDNPLSYNVMPLPQSEPLRGQTKTFGYILKNFTYYEKIRFDGDQPNNTDIAVPASAPNRGSSSLQVPTALFYEQRIFFAEGQSKDTTVHVENGAWLNLVTGQKLDMPYEAITLDSPNQQPRNITIAKQMSVPHGNSILALGTFTGKQDGAPDIPPAPSVFPTPAGLDTTPYTSDENLDYQNPQPEYAANTNLPLQTAVGLIKPNAYMKWSVDTKDMGQTMNIPFEDAAAKVTNYSASYWLLSTDNGMTYKYLAYTQNISMTLTIGGKKYNFPHVTSNVLTKD